MPIGDPDGFGRTEEPVSAFVATVVAEVGVVATVGMALSVAGMITGDQTLSQIGAVVGLAGAAFNMAQAGTFGADAQSWAESAAKGFTNTAQNISATATPGADLAGGFGSEFGTATTGTGVEGAAASTAATIEAPVSYNLADAPSAASVAPTDLGNAATPFDGMPTDSVSNGLMAPAETPPSVGAQTPTAPGLNGGDGATMLDGAKTADAASLVNTGKESVSSSILDGIGKFVKGNKELVEVGLKFGQGLFVDDDAKNRALNAQASYYDAKTGEIATQQANANYVPSLMGRMSVNPAANLQRPGGSAYVTPIRSSGLMTRGA